MLFEIYSFGSLHVWIKYFDNILIKFSHVFEIPTYSTNEPLNHGLSAPIYLIGQNHHQSQGIICFLETSYTSKNIPLQHDSSHIEFSIPKPRMQVFGHDLW